MNLLYKNSMEELYLFSLKVEEKLARKRQEKSRRSFIGRGSMSGRENPVGWNQKIEVVTIDFDDLTLEVQVEVDDSK